MRVIVSVFIWLLPIVTFAQNIGIGTSIPNSKAILDLTSTSRVFLPPRMTDVQMNAISSPPYGSLIYNTDLHQFMGYIKSHTTKTLLGGTTTVNKWLPLNTGPKMLAWGVVDSFGNEINGSENYSVTWDGYGNGSASTTNNWYKLTIASNKFFKDSMLLMVTAVGNGSWDQAIAVGELLEGTIQRATIKFTDVSRIANNFTLEASRRRSNFYFVLYDLRKDPF
ncbi:hypothetical protein [Phnomibacter sp. MR]|uniref:hypothetical protein n=1 Tax=Phnomibacter sp. MR TaxID=3042318 RepID=UPI003A7FDE48